MSMSKSIVLLGVIVTSCTHLLNAWPITAPVLLDMAAANLDQFQSWTIEGEIMLDRQANGQKEKRVESFDVRFDGTRVSNRTRRYQGTGSSGETLGGNKADYLSLLWDGHRYTKYHKPARENPGQVIVDDFSAASARTKRVEVAALQLAHQARCLMGRGANSFERIDRLLHKVDTVAVRSEMETVNGVRCYVVDARTPQGDYTAWIDPAHGFNFARWEIRMSRDDGHLWQDDEILGVDTFSERVEISHFEKTRGVWIGTQAVQTWGYVSRDDFLTETSHIKVTKFVPNPDHEASKSFVPDDIPDGTLALIAPVTHIQYLWHAGGTLTLHFDEDVVARIDKTLAELRGETAESERVSVEAVPQKAPDAELDPNGGKAGTVKDETAGLKPRPHCGLYCLYSILKLSGQEVDFRELVKPEYYGRLMGSSLAELNQGAEDYGLYAGVVTRLSKRALRDCPYWAILHVRRSPEAKEYDHYQLFLGTENGRAKLFNPPEGVKLVSFSDLAPLWDGYALFVSPRPFNVDAIFTADRQRLLLYAGVGCLILVAAHLGRRVWLAFVGRLSRRWALGLTAGQAGLLALGAVFCGGFYHFVNDEGLLANAGATASFQKAYQGGFIPRISHQKARALLGTGTVFIDARLAADYERGHLDGAISVPVDANDTLRQKRTSALPKNSRIVLYCQSAGCKFAERVAVRLLDDGFTNLAIFKGGWTEWTEKYGTPDPNQSDRKDEQSTNQP
jgi:rhodanese-related sulfurtransferase